MFSCNESLQSHDYSCIALVWSDKLANDLELSTTRVHSYSVRQFASLTVTFRELWEPLSGFAEWTNCALSRALWASTTCCKPFFLHKHSSTWSSHSMMQHDKMCPWITMGRHFIHQLFHRKETQLKAKTEHKTESLASHQIEAARTQ